jgi:hypothetical protein
MEAHPRISKYYNNYYAHFGPDNAFSTETSSLEKTAK